MKNYWNAKTAVFVILLAGAAAFQPAMRAEFTNWDDDAYVVNNPAIKHLSPKNAAGFFVSAHRGLYKPLVLLSFAVDYKIAGLNPVMYHATNILLHLGCCVLVFFLIRSLAASLEAAFFAALLFAVHPMRAETVAWVSERKDLLYAFFALASMLAYQLWKKGSKTAYAAGLVFYALSLSAKPTAVFLPAALILLDYAGEKKTGKSAWRGLILDKLPFFALAAAASALAAFTLTKADVFYARGYGFWDNCCVAGYQILAYLRRAVWPVNLSAVYPYPQKISGSLPLAFEAAPWLAFLILAAAFYAARKNKKIIFGLAFFLVSVAPGLQFFPLTPSVAFDHYTYIPYIGLFYLAGEGFSSLWEKFPAKRRAFALGFGFIALLLCAGTWNRCLVWKNSLTLWSDTLKKYPQSTIALNNRATAFISAGRFDEARADLETALRLDPLDAEARANLGGIYHIAGRLEEALAEYRKAQTLNPKLIRLGLNRGMVYAAMKNYGAAGAEFNSVILAEPANADAYARRGNLSELQADYGAAEEDYLRALAIDPDRPAVKKSLISLLLKRGGGRALREIAELLNLPPDSAKVYYSAAALRLENGDYAAAAGDYSSAIKLGENSAEVYSRRAAAYGAAGLVEKSFADYRKALELNPAFTEAYYNRGFMLLALKKFREAVSDMNSVLSLKPDSGGARLTRGTAYLSLGEYEKAAADFTAAIGLNYSPEKAYNNRGLAYFSLGLYEQAESDWRQALALSPSDFRARTSLAGVLLARGKKAEAAAELKKVLNQNPGFAPAERLSEKVK